VFHNGFGLKRGNEVYAEIVSNALKASMQAVIRGKVAPEYVLYTNGWRGYAGPADLGFDTLFRVSHSDNEFAKGSLVPCLAFMMARQSADAAKVARLDDSGMTPGLRDAEHVVAESVLYHVHSSSISRDGLDRDPTECL
jgi:hypothetical protein